MISDLKFAEGVKIRGLNICHYQFLAYVPAKKIRNLLSNRRMSRKEWAIFINQTERMMSDVLLLIRCILCRG